MIAAHPHISASFSHLCVNKNAACASKNKFTLPRNVYLYIWMCFAVFSQRWIRLASRQKDTSCLSSEHILCQTPLLLSRHVDKAFSPTPHMTFHCLPVFVSSEERIQCQTIDRIGHTRTRSERLTSGHVNQTWNTDTILWNSGRKHCFWSMPLSLAETASSVECLIICFFIDVFNYTSLLMSFKLHIANIYCY